MAERPRRPADLTPGRANGLTRAGARGTVRIIGLSRALGVTTMSTRKWTLMLAVLAVWGATDPGRAAGFFEKNFYLSGPRYSADVPLCEEYGPLSTIRSRFSTKEGRFWNSDLTIVDFANVREIAFRPWVAGAIPRRFCRAEALISDGVRRPVYYSIIEDGGLIGATYGVDWCVVGLDRNWSFNPSCKMAKP
jgi:hypothetical protein